MQKEMGGTVLINQEPGSQPGSLKEERKERRHWRGGREGRGRKELTASWGRRLARRGQLEAQKRVEKRFSNNLFSFWQIIIEFPRDGQIFCPRSSSCVLHFTHHMELCRCNDFEAISTKTSRINPADKFTSSIKSVVLCH